MAPQLPQFTACRRALTRLPVYDTYTHMKTTIEIAPALLDRGKHIARDEQVTLRALVEEGLRKVIAEREQRPAFRLRKVPFTGGGFGRGFEDGSWNQVRDAVYEGRGA